MRKKGSISKLKETSFVKWVARLNLVAFVVVIVVVFLSTISAKAETITRLEEGATENKLVYYELTKTKEFLNVPKGLNVKQAQDLVEGRVPFINLLPRLDTFMGLPIIDVSGTVSFNKGFVMRGDIHVNWLVVGALILMVFSASLLGVVVPSRGLGDTAAMFSFIVISFSFVILVAVSSSPSTTFLSITMIMTAPTLVFVFLKKMRERRNASKLQLGVS